MAEIHETAIISPRAELGEGVTVGPYAIVDGPAAIGDGTVVGPYALIEGAVTMGQRCRVFSHAVLGTIPQDLKFEGEESNLVIGDGTTVREFVTVNRGTKASGTTRVGAGCLLMAYAHVAHDCVLGDNVVLANCATLAGHVEIGDYAFIGGLAAVHQFTRVGKHAYIGGMSRVSQDIIPYSLIASEPTRVVGVNVVGLQRRGFPPQTRTALKQAYQIIYRENLNKTQAIARLEAELGNVSEVGDVIDFLKSSERGVLK
ncbi:MAG: acyl-ACP--UDP-N-acetylglucosamine O-acyltransferase [candidate division Zixibacteria bacterium]|nr:acyl-ACP--UDP-N-acetylglucosamine O-acyltransferase [candidate division Zixibacteria bacterium]